MTFDTCMSCTSCIEVLLFFVVACLNKASAEDIFVVRRRPVTNGDFHRNDWDPEFISKRRRYEIGKQAVIIFIWIVGTAMLFLLCYRCFRRRQLRSNPGVIVHGAPALSVTPHQRPPPLPSQPLAAGFIPSPYSAPYPPQTALYQAPYPTAYSPSVNMFDQRSVPAPASPPPPYSRTVASPFFEPEKRQS
ncbi:protein shisa-5-like isoform X2 [Ornithodoros turicata]